jgi:hypothetical protein
VAVQPLSYHRLRSGPPGRVIGYAATTPDRLREGVRLVAEALREAGCDPYSTNGVTPGATPPALPLPPPPRPLH